jgi:hypothetical protein
MAASSGAALVSHSVASADGIDRRPRPADSEPEAPVAVLEGTDRDVELEPGDRAREADRAV